MSDSTQGLKSITGVLAACQKEIEIARRAEERRRIEREAFDSEDMARREMRMNHMRAEAIELAVSQATKAKGQWSFRISVQNEWTYKDPEVLNALAQLGVEVAFGEAREHMSGNNSSRYIFRLKPKP